jgi:hypothetical protein
MRGQASQCVSDCVTTYGFSGNWAAVWGSALSLALLVGWGVWRARADRPEPVPEPVVEEMTIYFVLDDDEEEE